MKTIYAADLFCGAGGTSLGLSEACAEMGFDLELLAVNHWPIAIATHSKNHKFARHMCETLDGVDPRKVVSRGKLDLLVASPECTHHSNARGGKPMSDQSRASAWHVVRWADALRIDSILVENVREFASWGPLGANGRPLKSRRGETFEAFLQALRSLGYSLDRRVLNAANYGDPTTRERLFVLAQKGNRVIVWPPASHSKQGGKDLWGETKKWRPAREIIDWQDHGRSIFNRERPLSPNTMRRIIVGLRKFSGLDLEPFLVNFYGTGTASSVDKPAPSVTAQGGHVAVAQPFLIGQQSPAQPRSTEEPAPTVASKGAIAKVEPFMIAHFGERPGQEPRTHDLNAPAPAVTSRGAAELVQPFLTEFHGGPDAAQRVKSTEEPLPTQTTEPRFGLAQPFMMSAGGPAVGPRSTEDPAHTVLTRDHIGVVRPFIVGAGGPRGQGRPQSVEEPLGTVIGQNHRAVIVPVTHSPKNGEDPGGRAQSVDAPLPTVTTAKRGELGLAEAAFVLPKRGRYGHNQPRSVEEPVQTVVPHHGAGYIVQAFLVQYNGTADAKSLEEPLGTLTSKPHYALLVTYADGQKFLLDILFRMLRPRELARAQGFPDNFEFEGTTEQVVRQIGNAVPRNLAKALCKAALARKEKRCP